MSVRDRIPLWLFGAGIGVCVGTHVSQLTWWTVVKLIVFWPFAMGYEMTSFLLARGW